LGSTVTEAQSCFIVTQGKVENLDGMCGRPGSVSPKTEQPPETVQPTETEERTEALQFGFGELSASYEDVDQSSTLQPEKDLNWMKENCGNLDTQGRFLEPGENSSELCKREFKAWSEVVKNSQICKSRMPDISDDMQRVIDRQCNRFVSN
jgi:hypothetical protein